MFFFSLVVLGLFNFLHGFFFFFGVIWVGFLDYFLLQISLVFGEFGLSSWWLMVMGGFRLSYNFLLGLWIVEQNEFF